jgi:hypothetical protein
MVIEPGQQITWERHDKIYEGQVSHIDSDPHSITGEAYVAIWIDPSTGVAKETTVYPSEVCLDQMVLQRHKQLKRHTELMKQEDLDD